MEFTIFGVFSHWLYQKQKQDLSAGKEVSTDLNDNELTIIANENGVSNNVIKLTYSMWKVAKPTKKIVGSICQKAMELNNKEKVFLFNCICPTENMVLSNTDFNKQFCRGNKAEQVAMESEEIGLYSASDEYFFNDKDFGFMSFNELRNSELSMAIQDWIDTRN